MAPRPSAQQGCGGGRQLGPETPEALNPQGAGPFSSTASTPHPTLVTCTAPFPTPRLLVTSPILSFRLPRIRPGQSLAVSLGKSFNLWACFLRCEMRRGTRLPYLAVGRGQEDDICKMLNVGPAHGKGPTHLQGHHHSFLLNSFTVACSRAGSKCLKGTPVGGEHERRLGDEDPRISPWSSPALTSLPTIREA